ncbi:MAG: MBOAT family protein, partial [Betaproteobacteria bacterium]
MLFNSHAFIFLFLPLTLLVFFGLGRFSAKLAAGWLAVASLFFYGWWSPAYVALLLLSILCNFSAGSALLRSHC